MARLIPKLTYGNDDGYPERLLIPLEECAWNESDMPIEHRGVDGEWLFNLVHEVNYQRNRCVDQYHYQERASINLDNVPWPDYPSAMAGNLTASSLVSAHIIPWTSEILAPLFARVPIGARGKPSTFVSYTWTSGLLDMGYGVIYAIQQYLRSNSFIWMDLFCHNQHKIGSVARQMEQVIAGVDRVLLPMSEHPWYDRTWCIWEVLCALRYNKEIVFLDYDRKERDYRNIHSYFLENFKSIASSGTSLEEDKNEITGAVLDFFGSMEEADHYFVTLMKEKIG
jgi:hypothetical protein